MSKKEEDQASSYFNLPLLHYSINNKSSQTYSYIIYSYIILTKNRK